ALSATEARGKILGYMVTFEALDQRGPRAGAHLPATYSSYARVVPRRGYKITVSAENSRGRSPPASILAHLSTRALPPPQQVSAAATRNGSILVSWKAPEEWTASISGYVVEWAETPRTMHPPLPAWVKLPASKLSTVIAEHIQANMCYQISIFVLYQDRAGQAASVSGYSSTAAPSAGPQMYPTQQANGILVSRDTIPAQQQGDCITGYQQKKDKEDALEAYGAGNWMTPVLTCSFFIFSACICSMPPARKVLHSLFSALVPQWQGKAIPDPANATWAKNYLATKAELCLPSSLFLHSSEEPEITKVEETLVKPSPLGSAGSGAWRLASSSGEPGYQALPSAADGEEQQLHHLYKKMGTEGMEPTQPEYIANPITDTGYLPPLTDTTENHLEPECDPLSVFPTTFLAPVLSRGGNLTLDAVRINHSSFTR
ncbi:PREDICTED: interleukin-12 receptor subunit beta-2, partial [Mesitornis unicolor]|uniref:interleukin-12 receptor subunit beta-2 n=1 Tax=Mesitornis unicolor TaxID=54374 RepID=UPI0005289732